MTTATAAEVTLEAHGFDAFGKPRGRDWQPSADRLHPAGDYGTVSEFGFTKHEHLDDTFLIHMNGRVYDYRLGRFLGVDPIISNPENSQSINPYSYIGNNPLSGTDPTGYCEDTLTGSHICGVVPAGPLTINGYTIPGYVVSMVRRFTDNGGGGSVPNVSLAPDKTGNPNQTASQDNTAGNDKRVYKFPFDPMSMDWKRGSVENHPNEWFVDDEGRVKQTGDDARWRTDVRMTTAERISRFLEMMPIGAVETAGASVGRFALKNGVLQLT